METTIFNDGSLYDAQYGALTKDLRFYQNLAIVSGGPVLELAVGTGRVAFPILQSGIEVIGLDLSEKMLSRASNTTRNSPTPCRLIRADYRDFSLKTTFPLIFCAFNALLHLYSHEEFLKMLECVRLHLSPNGLFAFDIFQPTLAMLKSQNAVPELRERFFDERSGQVCDLMETYTYDGTTQIKACRWEYRWADGSFRHETIQIRIYFLDELKSLLARAGFRIEHLYGDFDGTPFGPSSSKQILICRAKAPSDLPHFVSKQENHSIK